MPLSGPEGNHGAAPACVMGPSLLAGLEPWVRLAVAAPEGIEVDPAVIARRLEGQALRAWRVARGDSQAELGAAIGVAGRTVRAWEHGEHRISGDHRRALARRGFVIPTAPAPRRFFWRGKWRRW